jgi:hypothetical protein
MNRHRRRRISTLHEEREQESQNEASEENEDDRVIRPHRLAIVPLPTQRPGASDRFIRGGLVFKPDNLPLDRLPDHGSTDMEEKEGLR